MHITLYDLIFLNVCIRSGIIVLRSNCDLTNVFFFSVERKGTDPDQDQQVMIKKASTIKRKMTNTLIDMIEEINTINIVIKTINIQRKMIGT